MRSMIHGLIGGAMLAVLALVAPATAAAGALGMRLTTSGVLDTSYGTGGYAYDATSNYVVDAASDSTGRVVFLSQYGVTATLSRFSATGARDLTFGTNGQVSLAFPGYLGAWHGRVAVDASGRIVVATGAVFHNDRDGQHWRLGVMRFDANGRPDTTFGGGAAYAILTQDWPKDPGVGGLTTAPDGGIVIAGWWQVLTYQGPTNATYFMRLTSAGALDTTFNSTGIQGIAGSNGPVDVRVDSSGRVVAALASTFNGKPTVMLARFGTQGLPDWGFGLQGIIRYSPSGYDAWPRAMVLSGGKILVAGEARLSTGGSTLVLLERFNDNGFPDTTLDQDGIVLAWAGSGDHATGGLGVDKYGRIVVGATLGSQPAFLRFVSNGTLDGTFGFYGATVLTYPGGVFGMAMVRVDPLGQVRSVVSASTPPR